MTAATYSVLETAAWGRLLAATVVVVGAAILLAAGIDLHEPHAPLDQPAGQQMRLAPGMAAIALADRVGFLVQVERRQFTTRH